MVTELMTWIGDIQIVREDCPRCSTHFVHDGNIACQCMDASVNSDVQTVLQWTQARPYCLISMGVQRDDGKWNGNNCHNIKHFYHHTQIQLL